MVVETNERNGRAPRILLLYYSFSGQSRKVLEAAGGVFTQHGCEVVEAGIEFTDPQYAPRFAQFPLRRVWPDMLSVLKAQQRGETGEIRTPDVVRDGEYDLVCIGSPIGNAVAGPLLGISGSIQEFSLTGLIIAFVGAVILLGNVNIVQRRNFR